MVRLTLVFLLAVGIVIAGVFAVPFTVLEGYGGNQTAISCMKANIVSAVKQYALKNKELPVHVTQLLSPTLGGKGSLSHESIYDPWGRYYTITYLNADLDHPIFQVTTGGRDGKQPIVVYSE